MSELTIEENKLTRALKRIAEGGELLEFPTWLIGSHEDAQFVYGVFIGSRELMASILEINKDFRVVGRLETTREQEINLH